MNEITVKYRLIIYDVDSDHYDFSIHDNLFECFDGNILFPDMMKKLVQKHGICPFQIFVENLKQLTWGTLFKCYLLDDINGYDFHYKWLNSRISDLQDTFGLFDSELSIVIDGPGIGGGVGSYEGIKFTINANEKDRHAYEPHVHCEYSGESLRLLIKNSQIMKNDKPFKNLKKLKKAQEWVQKNQQELLNCYLKINDIENNSVVFEANI